MLNDRDVLNYGIKKLIDLEDHFLSKLAVYNVIANGNAKTLINRLQVEDSKYLTKLKELLDLAQTD